ncbi:MAG: fibrobacter succinogenes major paralogous domain-containing protein [Alistipes sp.]|nr:fibrobacter succinogenes major paralogous domain-containing protein [Alistipes sp.]
MLFASASGYRTHTTGALTNVGTYGTCWASSPAAAGNVNAGDLWFHAEKVLSLDSSGRANAFSVRCVQHLQAAFLPATKNAPS